MNYEREFRGIWIPREVWLDARLSPLDKIILVEIDSLDNEKYGACIAGNDYLAEFCQCSQSKVSKSVKNLISLGYVRVVSFDGRRRFLKSCLSFSTTLNTESEKRQSSLVKNAMQESKKSEAGEQKLLPINNNILSVDINKDNNSVCGKATTTRTRFSVPTVEAVQSYCIERKNSVDAVRFVDYYSSNGWMVGKNKMKDWKAAVRTWERNGGNNNGRTAKPVEPVRDYSGGHVF